MIDQDLEQLLRDSAARGVAHSASCPDEIAIAGYVDGGLEDDARENVERHLVSCDECVRQVGFLSRATDTPAPQPAPEELQRRARELVSARKSRPAGGRSSQRRWAALAAGVLLVTSVVLWNLQEHGATDEGGEIRLVGPAVMGPEVLHPIEGSTVPIDSLWIRWTPEPPSLFYEVRVVDGDGGLLWQDRVEGTEVLLPEGLGLIAGEDYYVRVSANLVGGKTLKSSHVGFRVGEGP